MATKRVNQIVMAATAADFIAGRNGLIDTPEGTKRIPGNLLTFLGNVHFVSNAEYVYAVVDSNNTFLFGVRKDGSFSWSKGMSEELQTKLESIFGSLESLDNRKVDKEEGKSLVNATFASGVIITSNDEYALAFVDSNSTLLFGVKRDGAFVFAKGVPEPMQKALQSVFEQLDSAKVDKVAGKSLIDSTFAAGLSYSATEYLYTIVDSEGHVVWAIRKDGSMYWAKGMSEDLRTILATKANITDVDLLLDTKVDKAEGKSLIDATFADNLSYDNTEYLYVLKDVGGRILAAIKNDGSFFWQKGMSAELKGELARIWSAFDDIANNSLYGKKLLIIGDSLTQLQTYTIPLEENFGCFIYNRGAGGTSVADRSGSSSSFCQRFDLTENNNKGPNANGFPGRSNIDAVVVWGGINDWGNSLPLGAIDGVLDRGTLFGAYRYLLEGLKTRYYGKPIIVCSVHSPGHSTMFPNWNRATFNNDGSFTFRTNLQGKMLIDYHDCQKSVCDVLGIPFVDMFECGVSFMSEYDYEHYSYEQGDPATPDGLHFNSAGGEIVARYLANKITGLL